MNNVIVLSGVQRKWFSMLAGALCLFMATAALADNTKPCADDAAKLCQGVKPGGRQMGQCLRQHASELSPACKKNIAKAKRKARKFNKACKEDARQFCRDEKRGGGRILKCLAQHQDELSPACKGMMGKAINRE